jgi:endonuclease/exonuclease/phosphatase family metal-dependent hydrolase
MHLKIFSYNIHKGFNLGNFKFILPRIQSLLHEMQPDFVCLQEVLGHDISSTKHFGKKSYVPQFEFLAGELWSHYSYGKNVVSFKGHHGNAILSRYPIRTFLNLDISTNRFEARSFLHAIIELPPSKQSLHVICVHFGLSENGRDLQTTKLISRINSEVPAKEALIIAGDFNDWRGKLTQRLYNEINVEEAFIKLHGKHARTFPVIFPILKLDRIYYRGLSAISATCLYKNPWKLLSDHAALTSDFEIIHTNRLNDFK